MCFINSPKAKGFTLVELLVVVIILGVLASIVVPQFSSSTDDAKEAALNSTLTELRNSIELYYHQHGGVYPGAATDGTNLADTALSFTNQLTLFTSSAGVMSDTKDTTYKYGPYLKKTTFPANPIDASNTVLINSGATVGDLTATGTDAGGWWFDTTSGKFLANKTAYYSN